jgi:hypothetical protein
MKRTQGSRQEDEMLTNLNPKTKINQTSLDLNWAVRLAPQAYTMEECMGDLADEMAAPAAGRKSEADPIPGLQPEDFETAYQWFIS